MTNASAEWSGTLLLIRKLAGDVRIPAKSTVHAVLDRHGLVSQARKKSRANKAMGTPLSQAVQPNDLWCAGFKDEFNAERPHEGIAMKMPAELYTTSSSPYSGLPELIHPFHDKDVMVTACGRICMHRKKIKHFNRARRPEAWHHRSR